jgi:hypothetical protein
MFTLGNKEAIVNSTTAFPFVPATANVDILNIKGFGTFSKAKVVSAIARRASDAQLEKLSFTCPTSGALGIGATDVGVAVIVHIRVNSIRQASEFAIDFIKRGRPMILEVKINGSSADTVVATAVYAAFNEYALKFANVELPLTATLDGANIILEATKGYFTINENVSFLKRGDIFALNAVTSRSFDTGVVVNDAAATTGSTAIVLDSVAGLSVNDTIQFETNTAVDFKITEIVTATTTITITPAIGSTPELTDGDIVYKTQKGVEAINDGKFLEETVRMSTGFTSDAYAINAGQVPIIGDKYTMIQWVHDDPIAAGGWAAHKNPGAVAKQMTRNKFTLYFNESLLGATSQVKYLADWLVAGTPDIVTFKKANGASAADVADFWA